MRSTDEHLNYWGDRYVASGLLARVPFDRFLAMSVDARERLLAMQCACHAALQQAEAELPPEVELHDQHLVAPMRPGLRRWLKPWYMIRRRGGRRSHARR